MSFTFLDLAFYSCPTTLYKLQDPIMMRSCYHSYNQYHNRWTVICSRATHNKPSLYIYIYIHIYIDLQIYIYIQIYINMQAIITVIIIIIITVISTGSDLSQISVFHCSTFPLSPSQLNTYPSGLITGAITIWYLSSIISI